MARAGLSSGPESASPGTPLPEEAGAVAAKADNENFPVALRLLPGRERARRK